MALGGPSYATVECQFVMKVVHGALSCCFGVNTTFTLLCHHHLSSYHLYVGKINFIK